jgi:hypothetical protein
MWKKYSTAGQATDENVARANFMLVTLGFKHILSEWVVLTDFQLQQWLHGRTPL